MTKSAVPPRNKLKQNKPSVLAPAAKLKKGGVVKGKEVAVKHVALKKGGMAKGKKGC